MGSLPLAGRGPRRLVLALLLSIASSAATADRSADDLYVSDYVAYDGYSSYDDQNASSLIFNSIHDSMRQWGSSINYESKSAFLATIPAGVQLYHGTSKELPPKEGLKWLAFEPEHSMLFSHPAEHWSETFKVRNEPGQAGEVACEQANGDEEQQSLGDKPSCRERKSKTGLWQKFIDNDGWGYLHTYTASRPLRLLYLDGTSAAKTVLSTLDLQDKVILQDEFNFATHLDDDNVRAAEICRVAREEWKDGIDGFIRMETGFEVIVCSLADSGMESVPGATVAVQKIKDTFATYKALAQRFHNIGRDRVKVYYDTFFTLHGSQQKSLKQLKFEMEDLVMRQETEEIFNWQAVTDMIIQRFAIPLRLLSTKEAWTSKDEFDNEGKRLLLPFIDQRSRNREEEVSRCSAYFLPPASSQRASLASTSISHVSRLICGELISSIEDDSELPAAIDRISRLKERLDWSTWKECSPLCADDEVCYVPVWPFSLALDKRRTPSCVNEAGFFKIASEEMLTASSKSRAAN